MSSESTAGRPLVHQAAPHQRPSSKLVYLFVASAAGTSTDPTRVLAGDDECGQWPSCMLRIRLTSAHVCIQMHPGCTTEGLSRVQPSICRCSAAQTRAQTHKHAGMQTGRQTGARELGRVDGTVLGTALTIYINARMVSGRTPDSQSKDLRLSYLSGPKEG